MLLVVWRRARDYAAALHLIFLIHAFSFLDAVHTQTPLPFLTAYRASWSLLVPRARLRSDPTQPRSTSFSCALFSFLGAIHTQTPLLFLTARLMVPRARLRGHVQATADTGRANERSEGVSCHAGQRPDCQ